MAMEPAARTRWEQARPARDRNPSSACLAPEVTLEFDPSGWVYGCCANQLYPLGRIGVDRLGDIWSGPRRQVLVDALARWDLSIGCGSCQWHLERGRMDPDAAVYDTYEPDPDGAGPVAMTFALSNRCNLACAMCTPELSSTLRHQAGLAPLRSPYDDAFFDDLSAFLPGLRYAKFLGGEPFLIPEHHRVWDLMVKAGAPSRLQVTTNGTIWNDRVEWLLEHFAVDVTVSMDGATAATYEAIRSGASFEAVMANVERFAEACRSSGTELRFCFCLMPRNAHELAPFLAWADGLDAPVSINVVSDPGCALHDLDLAELRKTRDAWAAQDGVVLGRNRDVWDTQVHQLDEVLAERQAGRPPLARQALPAGPGALPVPVVSDDGAPDVADALGRLRAWSGGSGVVEVRGTRDGTITAVTGELPGLGLTSTLVGQRLDSVPAVLSQADGRPVWLLGVDDGTAGTVVRTFILCDHQPDRGSSGLVIRVVALPGPDGWVALCAADDIYDRDRFLQIRSRDARSA